MPPVQQILLILALYVADPEGFRYVQTRDYIFESGAMKWGPWTHTMVAVSGQKEREVSAADVAKIRKILYYPY